jgi:hypothetical protein
MTVTPLVDDLMGDGRADEASARRTVGGGIVVSAGRRPSPVPRRVTMPHPDSADAVAFGRGCLDDDPEDDAAGGDAPPDADGELARLVDAACHEVEALGHGRVGTEHLLLAVVRAGGEVGRAFGLRRAGVAVVAAACAEQSVPEPLVAPDGTPALTQAAAAAVARATRRAAARERPPVVADLAIALLDAGRSARLLADLGVDRDDLADVLARDDLALPAVPPVRADVRPRVRAPIPVGTLAPVTPMLPGPADQASTARAGAVTAPLRIGPPPGSPARRLARARVGPVARPALDVPA